MPTNHTPKCPACGKFVNYGKLSDDINEFGRYGWYCTAACTWMKDDTSRNPFGIPCINCGQTEGEVYTGPPHDHVCADCGRELPHNMAHSKSEYRRITIQGGNILPPQEKNGKKTS